MYKKIVYTITALALVAGLGMAAGAVNAQIASPTVTPTVSPLVSPTVSPTLSPAITPVGGGVTPGAPDTGAGGDMTLNLLLLLTSGAIAVGGITYLVRSFYVRQD